MQTQTATAKAKPVAKREIAVVILGRDSKKKGHAASFSAADADLAIKAAKLMNLHVWQVPAGGQALALRVPKGKLFGSGRAFTPLVNAKLMAQLELIAGPKPGLAPTSAAEPAPDGAGEAAGGPSGAAGGTPSSTGEKPAPDSLTRPRDFGAITVGSEVLCTTGAHADGWFECAVVRQAGPDLFELRWIDWPTEPMIVRRRDNIGLLPPMQVG